MRVDLNDGLKRPNGIFKDNILYDENNFFYENGTLWGCICNVRKCIRKCCGPDQELLNKTCTNTDQRFQYKFYNVASRIENVKQEDFHIIFSRACPTNHVRIKLKAVFLQEDGTLFVQNFGIKYSANKYCIDTFNKETSAYLCEFYDEQISADHQAMIGTGKDEYY